MATPDVIVIGGGISGLAFAWKAAQAGHQVLVLEERGRIGGCIHSHRRDDGFWFELGAHTTYNSYGAFLDIAVGTRITERMVPRGAARARFGLLRDGQYTWLTPPKVLLQLDWLEAARRFPFHFFRSKDGQTVASYYSRLIGPGNFGRVLSPFLAAVPSQCADGFPVEGPGSLFKKRQRRKQFARSFGFTGGLQTVCDAAASADGITVQTGVRVSGVARHGEAFTVTCADGRVLDAALVAVAAPPDGAAALLRGAFPQVAAAIDRVDTVSVESMAVVLPREKCWMPECAFVVPVEDLFFSVVTRDPFPDDRRRAFAFHFKGGTPRAEKLRRMGEVLRLEPSELDEVVEQRRTLPRPALGHAAVVAAIDRALEGDRLAVTGNYFAGLAIEDCVLRSNGEWARVERILQHGAGKGS